VIPQSSRVGIVSSLVALAVVSVPAVGQAAPPEVGTFPIDQHIEVLEPESTICGFDISWDVAGTGRYQEFRDAAGKVTRVHVSGVSSGTLSASGREITVHTALQRFESFVTGTVAYVGVIHQYRLPGTGVVLTDRGRVVFSFDPETGEMAGEPLFEAGPHPFLHGDVGGTCEALAP
jgi:hypothetical protein